MAKSKAEVADAVWPKTVYATAGQPVQELVYTQEELDDALVNGWRLSEESEQRD